jgi:hypothetical protein
MNARKKKCLPRILDKASPDSPPDHIEHRTLELEKDVAMLKDLSGWPGFTHRESGVLKKKPGPKQKIDDADLLHSRDALLNWLEPIWPWMEDRLSSARTAEEVRVVLASVAEDPYLRPDWQARFLDNARSLLEFMQSERFGKTLPKATVVNALTRPWEDAGRRRAANRLPARQIANAMAGVPDCTWRTSLDRCSKNPSNKIIAINLDMFYRDKFDIPAPKDRDLAGLCCPVPKPCQPISARLAINPRRH